MELRHYSKIIARWWWLIIASTICAAVIGFVVSKSQNPVYLATTTVMVGQPIMATDLAQLDFGKAEQLAQTYANIAQRQPVLQNVIESLRLDSSWQALKKRVQVKLVEGTQLLEISVEANSPEEARLTADQVASQLISVSSATPRNDLENQNFIRERLEDQKAKIELGQERIRELQNMLADASSPEQNEKIQGEINTLEGLISTWDNNSAQLLILLEDPISPNTLTVVEPAAVDFGKTRPHILLNTILAGMVGLSIALGTIFVLDYLDDTLKNKDEVNQFAEVPILGTIGRITGDHDREKLITKHEPLSPITESYRAILSRLQFMSEQQSSRTILVTSAMPGEGKSLTVANLGVIMAQANVKTIIVDADLRNPIIHGIFKLTNEMGLKDLLCSPDIKIGEILQKTEIANLQVITSGGRLENPSELLSLNLASKPFANLRDMADVIIFDSPPALLVSDATILANQVDQVILVIEAERSRRSTVRQAIDDLKLAGAKWIGCVLNRVPRRGEDYFYHEYYGSNGHKSVDDIAQILREHVIPNQR